MVDMWEAEQAAGENKNERTGQATRTETQPQQLRSRPKKAMADKRGTEQEAGANKNEQERTHHPRIMRGFVPQIPIEYQEYRNTETLPEPSKHVAFVICEWPIHLKDWVANACQICGDQCV